MSLTSFLKGKTEKERAFQSIIKEIQPDKCEFKTVSNKRAFSSDFIEKAPYNLSAPIHSMIVGTSFDYLARFMIAQVIEDNKSNVYSKIVAESFFYRFSITESNILKQLTEKFDNGIKYVEEFVNSSNAIDIQLIHYAYFFGRLEQCYRGGRLPENVEGLLASPYLEIEEDIINLVNVFKNEFVDVLVKPNSKVVFNPSFGECSIMIGGADADIFIDGVLYDFKTSRKRGYEGKDIQQLIGYYLFNQINIKLGDCFSSFVNIIGESIDIDRVGIYLARYGEINYIDTNSLELELKEKCIKNILQLFRDNEYIRKYIEKEEILERNLKIKKQREEKKRQEYEKNKEEIKKRMDEIVIITPNGTTFHTNEKCFALRKSTNKVNVTIEEALKQGKETECKLCNS